MNSLKIDALSSVQGVGEAAEKARHASEKKMPSRYRQPKSRCIVRMGDDFGHWQRYDSVFSANHAKGKVGYFAE
ncbi:hypothetical protein [uncultured Roseobacter sp.]|uniref:hypothetical protein n=1 Tax=uncultured Roseobacter sp. TaxID=114847 RepID=UPI002618FFED|nr:hypothetical protein [uncultured Roseobacter sp.]